MKRQVEIINYFSGIVSNQINHDLKRLKLEFLKKGIECFSFIYINDSNQQVDNIVFKFNDGYGIIEYDPNFIENLLICGADNLLFKEYKSPCNVGEFFKAFQLNVTTEEIISFFEETLE